MEPGLRWGWILLAGASSAALAWFLTPLSVFAYTYSLRLATGDSVPQTDIDAFARVAVFGLPLLQSLLVAVSVRVAITGRTEKRHVLHGVIVGVTSAVIGQVIGLFFAPFSWLQALRYLSLAVAGGYLGGFWSLVSQKRLEALLRTSRAIGTAGTPRSVARAIGENMPGVHEVSLWRTLPEDPAGSNLLAFWSLDGRPEPERAAAAGAAGDDGGLVLPLSVSGTGSGLMVVSFRGRVRPSRAAVRDYQTAGVQAALALENLRLVEEARRAGKEAGVTGERQRLSNEIHDTLAQGFNSIVMNLESMEGKLSPESGAVHRDLDTARRTARESLAEARRLVWALRPEALDRHNLPEALGLLTKRWSDETGLEAGLRVTGSPGSLPGEVEAALLRTAQETLSNARKHGGAVLRRVMITLSFVPGSVLLDALDDGAGFDRREVSERDRDSSSGGYGLRAMRERIEDLGGSVEVESSPGEGTSIAVELPVGDSHTPTTEARTEDSRTDGALPAGEGVR